MNERFESWIYLGIVLVVSDIVLLSQKGRGKRGNDWKRIDVLWPLMASTCYGFSVTLRKTGLNILDQPILGAAIGASASLSSYLLYLVLTMRVKIFSSLNRRSLVYFSFSGICSSLAWVFSYTATSEGAVTIVSALVSTYPLFALVLSHVFLREEITSHTLMGSILIIVGAIIITTL